MRGGSHAARRREEEERVLMIDQAKKKWLIDHIKQRETSCDREILIAPELFLMATRPSDARFASM
jgi:hypothetical protein